MNQPYILNYSNQTSTFPAYETITGAVKIQPNSLRLSITGNARDLTTIQAGWYLLCDTGDETSELRLITGINQAERKLIIAEPFTVTPTDTNIRVVKVQSANTVCVYNSGVSDLYVDGEVLAAGDKLLWSNMVGEPPIVLYGTGDYQVSNGDISLPNVFSPVNEITNNFSPTNNVSVSVPDGVKVDIETSSSGAVYAITTGAITAKTEETALDYNDMMLFYDDSETANNKVALETMAAGYNQPWFRNRRYTFFSDFINPIGTANGGSDLISTNSTGSTNNVATDNNVRVGLVRSTTGASATGRTSPSSASNCMRFGGGVWTYEVELDVTTLSTLAERFQLIVGFFDVQNAANQVDAAAFVYDEGGVSTGSAASANWQTLCSQASTRTFFTTANAVAAATWVNLKIIVNAAASQVDFYINDVLIKSETQNIPSGSGRELGFGWLLIKSIGSTARTVDFDYLYVEGDFDTSR